MPSTYGDLLHLLFSQKFVGTALLLLPFISSVSLHFLANCASSWLTLRCAMFTVSHARRVDKGAVRCENLTVLLVIQPLCPNFVARCRLAFRRDRGTFVVRSTCSQIAKAMPDDVGTKVVNRFKHSLPSINVLSS